MADPSLPLFCLERPPLQASQDPPLLIMLHGVGSNEEDLFGLAPYLDPRLHVLSARAPNRLMAGSYAWFHVRFENGRPLIDEGEAEASRETLVEFIEAAVKRQGLVHPRVFLLGFSQGAIMSYSVMLTRPQLLRGVMGMSGRVLPEVRPLAVPSDKLNGFPVLLQHGLYDQVLSIDYARQAREYLSSLHVGLTYREYRMGHQITDESLGDASVWLAAQLEQSLSEPQGIGE